MGIDAHCLGGLVKLDLKEAGYSDHQIERMSVAEAFDAYCDWNGLVNWGSTLRDALFEIASSSQECLLNTDQAKEDFIKKYYFDLD